MSETPRIQLPDAKKQASEILERGTVIESTSFPGGRSVVLEDRPDMSKKRLAGERVTRNWVRYVLRGKV